MAENAITVIVLIGLAGVVSQWLAWRLGIPAIVMMLVAGLIAGPGTGYLDPGHALGEELLEPAIALAVAIIVFEGGLNLDVRELRAGASGVARLVMAVPLNWFLGTLAAHYVGGVSLPIALLFGAIMVITGPTVILPMLRQARLHRRPATFLKWEGILNDPIGAVLAVVVLEYLVLSSWQDEGAVVSQLLLRLLFGIVVGAATGIGMAYLMRWAFRRDLAPEYLKTPILLAAVLGSFLLANTILSEAGLIASTLFGLTLANIHVAGLEELKRFKESLTVFLVSGVFIVLAADLEPAVFARLSWPIIGTVLAIMVLVRPIAIMLSTVGANMTLRERVLVSWIAPRGIVAAAVAGIASTRLQEAGYADAELLLPLVFSVIAATVVAHGFTVGPIARRLKLAGGGRPGVLIVGAWDWTIDLAQALRKADVPVIMADPDPAPLSAARRLGIPTFRGDLLSERSEEILDLQEVEYVVAATSDDAYNALLCARFAHTGRERVYQLAFRSGMQPGERAPSREWRGKILMRAAAGYDALRSLGRRGWRFSLHRVEGSELTPERMVAQDGHWTVAVVHDDGRITFASPETHQVPTESGSLLCFGPTEESKKTPANERPEAALAPGR